MISTTRLVETFAQHFGTSPTLIGRAPGRVNLIGEHTDYNEGFVLPVAIDRQAAVAARARDDREIHIFAEQFNERATLDLDRLSHDERSWSTYAAGMAALLEAHGYRLRGMDLVIMGDVPLASGLSSSAALEVALGTTFAALYGHQVPGVTLAQLAQRTENEWIGVNSGIMDQMISALGKAGHALLIDCRDYTSTPIPMPENVRIVVCDSKKSRELAHSAYNERRAQCEEAVRLLSEVLPHVHSLRDVTLEDFARHAELLTPVVRQRARHVVSENARVLASVQALQAGDLAQFGQLMNESHRSLRDDYAVSSKELDTLVEAAWNVEGTYGSRLTGAGFGGCTVSLVAPEAVPSFEQAVATAYEQTTGYRPDIYICVASQGAAAEWL